MRKLMLWIMVVTMLGLPVARALDCPSDAEVECGNDTSPASTGEVADGTYADVVRNCGDRTIIERTWTLGAESCLQIITVIDTTDPVAACDDIVLQLASDGKRWLVPADVDNGSSDVCGIVEATVVPEQFDCDDLGPNSVVLTVTDAAGNSDTCVSVVTVEDNIVPTAHCQDITVQLDVGGTAVIEAEDVDDGSTDARLDMTLSVVPNSFDCDDVGANVVVLSVTDGSGNIGRCQAVATVEDNVAPVAKCQDITVQLDDDGAVAIVGADVDDGSTDACGIASLVVVPDRFGCGNVGPNDVVLTVTDVNGNSSTCDAVVTVEDNIDPVIDCPDDVTLECPANTSVAANGSATATDNCPGVGVESEDAAGQRMRRDQDDRAHLDGDGCFRQQRDLRADDHGGGHDGSGHRVPGQRDAGMSGRYRSGRHGRRRPAATPAAAWISRMSTQ